MANRQYALPGGALPGEDDPLGLWQKAPEVSFGLGPAAKASPPVEVVELPDSFDEVRAWLDVRRRALRRGEAKLEEAQQRLNRLGEAQRRQGPEVSFAPPTDLSGPEAALWASLNSARGMPSFSLAQQDPEQAETRRQWQTFVDRVRHMVAHPTRVETKRWRQAVGYTSVGWTGDFETIWRPGASPDSMFLHHQALQLTLSKRAARLRLWVVVSTGAARLILQLATPGGHLLVIPATWKFVRDVLKEMRQ